MEKIKLFLKGIIIGIGGIAPGLSGSVLMVILGLYSKIINSIATLFKDFKKNFIYLFPIGSGILLGIVAFSKIINYSMENFEIQTRLAFFGLLVGTIPIFYKDVKKYKNLNKNHYLIIILAFILGMYFLTFVSAIKISGNLNIFQAFIIGFVGISATIVPGLDGASILSALGLYNKWLDLTSLNIINLNIYIFLGLGIISGAFILSALINMMIKKNYTVTFSALFGFFLSIVPSILKTSNGRFISLNNNSSSYMGIIIFIIGILISYFFGKIEKEKI